MYTLAADSHKTHILSVLIIYIYLLSRREFHLVQVGPEIHITHTSGHLKLHNCCFWLCPARLLLTSSPRSPLSPSAPRGPGSPCHDTHIYMRHVSCSVHHRPACVYLCVDLPEVPEVHSFQLFLVHRLFQDHPVTGTKCLIPHHMKII